MIDLDRLPVYDVQTVVDLSVRVAGLLNSYGEQPANPLDEYAARELLSKSGFGEVSLPRRVVLATTGQWKEGSPNGL
jgi:hypothetical protein